jgi:2-haloacid dehalogenase
MLTTVVFDLGGVLIDWDPRYLYRKLFCGDEAAMERFLTEICTGAWNSQQDAGRNWEEAIAELSALYPAYASMIKAFRSRWQEMLAGEIEGTVGILRELKCAGIGLYAVTNWSHEMFPIALERFAFLSCFKGIIVSGAERVVKPDARIFALLTERYGLYPNEMVFVDDSPVNVAAATACGMHGIHFVSPADLRASLTALGLLLSGVDT